MTNSFVSSLNDRMTQLDSYATKIWDSFASMISTIIEYVKYFLAVAFKSAGYVLTLFIIFFIVIMIFSKERKENLYVLLYFFIAFTMIVIFGSGIYLIMILIEIITEIYDNIVKISNPDRTNGQKFSLGISIFLFVLLCVAIFFAIIIMAIGLSFLHSIEIELFDQIDYIFKDLIN
jgi:hypothetical protein